MNIWSIKNRWLRAAVTIPTILVIAVGVVVGGLLFAIWDGLVAAGRSIADTSKQVAESWGEFRATAWAAMTGKDEPK